MSQTIRIFVSTSLITSNLALRKRIHFITELSGSCHPTFAMYDENLVPFELYYISVSYSINIGFGGLEVACWPLVPKFAGSNPAEAVGFLRAKKSSARLPSEGK